jgi:hypothetical protein
MNSHPRPREPNAMLTWKQDGPTSLRHDVEIADITIHIEHHADGWRIFDGRLFGGDKIAHTDLTAEQARASAIDRVRQAALAIIDAIDTHQAALRGN